MKKTFASLAVAGALALTATVSYAQDATTAPAGELKIAGVRIGNPIDPSTWWDRSATKAEGAVEVNFADPEFWTSMIDPSKNSQMDALMMDPANWNQFLKLATYIKMMDLKTWAKWADPKSYEAFIKPETYTYWMQPGAYVYQMNPLNYAEMVNVEKYSTLFNESAKIVGYEMEAPKGWDLLSLSAWAEAAKKPLS